MPDILSRGIQKLHPLSKFDKFVVGSQKQGKLPPTSLAFLSIVASFQNTTRFEMA
jgi:hypothetical protein